ncbi:hypothetical protein J7L67_08380 [bacterium]|nr:hypothetical protein [bacterium]
MTLRIRPKQAFYPDFDSITISTGIFYISLFRNSPIKDSKIVELQGIVRTSSFKVKDKTNYNTEVLVNKYSLHGKYYLGYVNLIYGSGNSSFLLVNLGTSLGGFFCSLILFRKTKTIKPTGITRNKIPE